MEEEKVETKEEKIKKIGELFAKIPAEDHAEFVYSFAENEYLRGTQDGQKVAMELAKHMKKASDKKIITG